MVRTVDCGLRTLEFAKERRSKAAERDAFRARIITLTNWPRYLEHRRCWPRGDDTETFVHQ